MSAATRVSLQVSEATQKKTPSNGERPGRLRRTKLWCVEAAEGLRD